MNKIVKVLCVGDDPTEREAIQDYAEILDWPVMFAKDGPEAQSLANSHAFDVVFLSVDLGEPVAMSIIQSLREKSSVNAETPIVLNNAPHDDGTLSGPSAPNIHPVETQPLLFTSFKNQILKLSRQ